MRVRLRPARAADARRLWLWANDPETRHASFTPGRIAWSVHLEWLRAKLASSATRIYLAMGAGGRAVGQVRFELDRPGRAVVSIVVAPKARGRGIGKLLLTAAIARSAEEFGIHLIHAYVKQDNLASLAIFRAAGFRRVRSLVRGKVPSVLLSRPVK
jgi:RimJ/RimL family protein N-acetyltransferase